MNHYRPLLPFVALLLVGAGCDRGADSGVLPAPSASALPSSSPLFEDATTAAGIEFRSAIAGPRPCTILQTIGTGVAFLDYDADGNLDLLFVSAKPLLYRGDGKGKFADVTSSSLSAPSARYHGVAVGDYDNDGFDDVYLSGFRCGALLHNEGGKRLVVAPGNPIPAQPWGSSATFSDFDGDGRLDLFVGNYVQFGPNVEPQLCKINAAETACGPIKYRPERGALYRNLGGGRFEDATKPWKLDSAPGRTLGVASAPWGENSLALAVANDETPGSLHVFSGKSQRDFGAASGMAYAADGKVYAGMGIDWGDYDGDGQLDLAAAAYQNQAKLIFRRDGDVFEPQDIARIGLMSSVSSITFGLKWSDFDNDGWLDLLLANGPVQDNAKLVNALTPGGGLPFQQPLIAYRSELGKKFLDVSSGLVRGAARPIVGRGLATGDYDNDGRLDAVAVDLEGAPILLHNVSEKPGHWLRVKLEGRKTNRNGYGALLTLTLPGGRKLVRHCQSDGSYESASDARVWFGLGDATSGELTVRWPSGAVQKVGKVGIDRTIRVREPV